MNQKPKEIIEIETLLGIEIREIKNLEQFVKQPNTYLAADNNIVFGLNLSENRIQDLSFLSNCSFLSCLILDWIDNQNITALSNLQHLVYLSLKANHIADITPLSQLNKLKVLYLGSNEIENIEALANLTLLETLDLSNNPSIDIAKICNLINVKELHLGFLTKMFNNKFYQAHKREDKPSVANIQFISNFSKLEVLGLTNFKKINLNWLQYLKKLRVLVLEHTQCDDFSFLAELKNLEYLDLNMIAVFSDGNETELSFLENSSSLKTLMLRHAKVKSVTFLSKLTNLEFLELSSNHVDNFYFLAYLPNLKELRLHEMKLTNNEINKIVELLKDVNLEYLDISRNKIEDFSILTKLTNLKSLHAYDNLFQSFEKDFLSKMPKLEELYLGGNPFRNIPLELLRSRRHNCMPNFIAYFKDLEKGKSPNNEVKIILIGNGSVGKTQVANRLEQGKDFVFEEKHDSTHAIDLHKKNLKCGFLENGLELNIWDFGGQDIYHATHHLFMQTRALFILVWDAENEKEDSQHEYKGVKYDNFPLRYWLEYAKYFGKESPMLVVRNKTDIHGKEYEMPKGVKESYQTEYPNIVGFVEVSAVAVKGDNFYGLERQILNVYEEKENLRNYLLPTAWVCMHNKIREKQQKEKKLQLISKEIFYDWCEKELIIDSAPILLDFFHQTGVLFYNEKYFSGQIILDQNWAIKALYMVLDKDAAYFVYLQEQQGKLNYRDICEIWQEYSEAQRELFLDFMISCELCFETTENKKYDTKLKDRTFFVPQLLNKEMNFALKNALLSLSLTEKETKKFAFLPTSLMQRFIIKAHSLAKIEDIWQKGILLRYENAFALVEAVYGREPYLQIQYNKEAKISLVPAIWAEFDKLEGKEKAKPHQERDFMEKVYWQGLDSLISPNKRINKKEIEIHFQKGEIEKVISLLLGYYDKKELGLYTEILQISARFYQNEKHLHKGIILPADYNVEWSKINDAILYILKKF